MEIFAHIALFVSAAVLLWFFSGILIETVDKIAKRFNKTGFVVAFFMLGFLTSIGEISVAFNSLIKGTPQVSVGNLIGASFVILLMIIPVLAIIGKGVSIEDTLSKKNLLLALGVIVLPALLVIDGDVTTLEGGVTLLAYLTLLFAIRNDHFSKSKIEEIKHEVIETVVEKKESFVAIAKVIVGGAAIFVAGNALVTESIYFADLLGVPGSLIGLMLLSIGTNIPELVVAVRAIKKGKKDIAFGNYLGSTVTNSATFGVLALFSGGIILQTKELAITSFLLLFGLLLLFHFAQSRHTISRNEGALLLVFYFIFIVVQGFAIFSAVSG